MKGGYIKFFNKQIYESEIKSLKKELKKSRC